MNKVLTNNSNINKLFIFLRGKNEEKINFYHYVNIYDCFNV